MQSVFDAKQLIKNNIQLLPCIDLPIEDALGYTLAEDIYSLVDVPFFDQSSMDGYALKFESLSNHESLKIVSKIQAGSSSNIELKMGEAARIFTGAAIPKGANTVVMQEKTKVIDDVLHIDAQSGLQLGCNVRLKGEEIQKDDMGLQKGNTLTAAGIGFLASIGIAQVSVYSHPKVGILITGDELVAVGKPLQYGQVYESNSHTVKSFLQSMGINAVKIYKSKDDLDQLVGVLNEAINDCDMVLLTGGISVGEYDFVSRATVICGIEKVFHKIKQKPGKPMFFGKKESKVIFGLPGNPTSVLSCAYQYVTIALEALSGSNRPLITLNCTSLHGYKKAIGMTHFLKGQYKNNNVEILEGQESYKLKSYALANCIVEVGEEVSELKAGEEVMIYLIP